MLQSRSSWAMKVGKAFRTDDSSAWSSSAVTAWPGASDPGTSGMSPPGPQDRTVRGRLDCYPRPTVRLIEIRLLEGPNVYRLEPVVKVEVAIGRRRTWYGRREPEAYALVRLGATVPAATWPEPVAAMVAWT